MISRALCAAAAAAACVAGPATAANYFLATATGVVSGGIDDHNTFGLGVGYDFTGQNKAFTALVLYDLDAGSRITGAEVDILRDFASAMYPVRGARLTIGSASYDIQNLEKADIYTFNYAAFATSGTLVDVSSQFPAGSTFFPLERILLDYGYGTGSLATGFYDSTAGGTGSFYINHTATYLSSDNTNLQLNIATFRIASARSGSLPPLASGTPEPGGWALMILGFGAAGATLRRRRSVLAA